RADIERELLDIGERLRAHGEQVNRPESETGEHGRISTPNLTFHGQLPEEVRTFLEGRPEARRLFRVTNDASQAHGEDAMSEMGQKYFDTIEQMATSKLSRSAEAAKNSPEPRHQ